VIGHVLPFRAKSYVFGAGRGVFGSVALGSVFDAVIAFSIARWMGNSGDAGRRCCVGRSPPEEPGEIGAGVLLIGRRSVCAGTTACCSERSL
jgi:hypothetical protein